MALEVGQAAPDFALRDQNRETQKLSDYRGTPVVLLFYPMDFSGVCTKEMVCMRDNLPRFKNLDAQVFGISVDTHYSHAVFAAQRPRHLGDDVDHQADLAGLKFGGDRAAPCRAIGQAGAPLGDKSFPLPEQGA